jgi:hypothetical protein
MEGIISISCFANHDLKGILRKVMASPRLAAICAISFIKLNHPDKADHIMRDLKIKSELNAGGSPSYYLAMIYAQPGHTGQAFT